MYEIIMFLSIFAGIYIAIHFSDFTAGFLREKVEVESEHLPIVAFGITFLLVILGFYFLAKLVSSLANASAAEMPNRIGGTIFSLAKTLLILSIAFVFIIGLNNKYKWIPQKQVDNSLLAEPVYKFSLFVLPALEKSDFYSKLKEQKLILMTKSDTTGVEN